MTSASVRTERFQVIAWRHAQITQIDGGVQITELAARDFDQIGRKAFRASPRKTASVDRSLNPRIMPCCIS
jgi:hypothetical protein